MTVPMPNMVRTITRLSGTKLVTNRGLKPPAIVNNF